MNIKTRIATTVALAAGLLTLVSTAVAAGPQAGFSDANERSVIAPSVPTLISDSVDAHQRSQVVGSAATTGAAGALGATLRLAPPRLVGHVDVFEPVTGQPTRLDERQHRQRIRLERGGDRSVVHAPARSPHRRERGHRPPFARRAARSLSPDAPRRRAAPPGAARRCAAPILMFNMNIDLPAARLLSETDWNLDSDETPRLLRLSPPSAPQGGRPTSCSSSRLSVSAGGRGRPLTVRFWPSPQADSLLHPYATLVWHVHLARGG